MLTANSERSPLSSNTVYAVNEASMSVLDEAVTKCQAGF